jgi:hypothetical protein
MLFRNRRTAWRTTRLADPYSPSTKQRTITWSPTQRLGQRARLAAISKRLTVPSNSGNTSCDNDLALNLEASECFQPTDGPIGCELNSVVVATVTVASISYMGLAPCCRFPPGKHQGTKNISLAKVAQAHAPALAISFHPGPIGEV